ncbi:MAG: hypothetical protein U0003_01575 [Vampirovibrionales bacterium]
MALTLPTTHNEYDSLLATLRTQFPHKVVTTLPHNSRSQLVQQMDTLWQKGLPKTGNPLLDGLIVNKVNDTVNITKNTVHQAKHNSIKGLLAGLWAGLVIQLAAFTGPRWYKGFKEGRQKELGLGKAIQAGFKALRPKWLVASTVAWCGTLSLLGWGAGLTLAGFKSLLQLKTVVFGGKPH